MGGGIGVKLRLADHRFSSRFAVYVPLVVLSAIFGGLLLAILIQLDSEDMPRLSTLVAGGSAYLGAMALLIRFGLNHVRQLEELGLTDSLSQVPNRRALHIDFQRHAESGEEAALALIDLDGFKLVNDHYGHFVGDRLIKECASLLREVCRDEARFYRLGGDEFAILVVGQIAGNILEGICRKLLGRLTAPFHIDDRTIVVGASIGLARSSAEERTSSSELLRRTDVAMYASKDAGKMRCTWFSSEFDKNRDLIRGIDAELRQALVNNQFRIHYQPLVDAHSRAIVAVEALLRWERPDGSRVGPDVFIPIAEESGLINAIGLWVLRQACLDAMDWHGIMLSVNVSAAQLRNPEFPIELGLILEETGFPPSRLELEVTETYLVIDPVVAGHSLEVIRDFGVGIVLDDFGTGYASIGFLRQFRFEKLKIDRSLIVDATCDEGSRAMMLASIAVARALDMDVTAEGVETQDQADLARTAGCDQMQGWLYFKAMAAEQISEHLTNAAGTSGEPDKLHKTRAA